MNRPMGIRARPAPWTKATFSPKSGERAPAPSARTAPMPRQLAEASSSTRFRKMEICIICLPHRVRQRAGRGIKIAITAKQVDYLEGNGFQAGAAPQSREGGEIGWR